MSRKERLADAQGLCLQGYYDEALGILRDVLGESPADIGALRLRGNVLELKAMDLFEHSGRKLTTSPDFLAARKCYEKILELEPENSKAKIDLGDHYRNLGAIDKALAYYQQAGAVLQAARVDADWKDDIDELLRAVSDLAKKEHVAMKAKELESMCRDLLLSKT